MSSFEVRKGCAMQNRRPEPVDQEYRFSEGVILSETDTEGIITFANHRFCRISGYEHDELIGRNHNIVRHPEMPRELFRRLWETIRQGKTWEGLIKNLRKDGRYYWVHTHIEPLRDGEVIRGYVAVRRPAEPAEIIEADLEYKALLIQEKARN
jgi:aerotaxis receptor